ncbi:MAG TPA: MBL fold metallo-hydrolase [Puia sp.]|nr:MBL fold metallo-hydrolase [Puia sp.]
MKSGLVGFLLLLGGIASSAQRISPDTIALSGGALIVQPIVHASVVLTLAGKTIYADPVGGAAKYEGLAAPDIILVTDIHGDHFDPATLRAIRREGTVLVVPQAVADKMPAAEKTGIVILGNGENKEILGIGVAAIPMYNLPASPTDPRHPKGRGNGYVLSARGNKLYLSGDTQGIPEMRALTGIDVAFVCMNLPYTMDIKEAAGAVLDFKPRIVYPYHYRGQGGFSDTEGFSKLVKAGDPDIDVRLRNWYPG